MCSLTASRCASNTAHAVSSTTDACFSLHDLNSLLSCTSLQNICISFHHRLRPWTCFRLLLKRLLNLSSVLTTAILDPLKFQTPRYFIYPFVILPLNLLSPDTLPIRTNLPLKIQPVLPLLEAPPSFQHKPWCHSTTPVTCM